MPKSLKTVLDTSLLNTQQYKLRILGKVEKSSERSSALPYTLVSELLKKVPSFGLEYGATWVKTGSENLDVLMGGYDSAQIADLVGLYIH